MVPTPVYDRVVEHADRDPVTGCLVSRYSVGSHGYAQAWCNGTVTLCHLIVWRYLEGEMPEGFTVDHTCHNRRCIERTHLRLLTNSDNASDNGQVRINPETGTLCNKGHPMVRSPSGATYCRDCQNARRRSRRALSRR